MRGATVHRVHGGADARGAARWDFSTCANAAGPCPPALAQVRAADTTRYPDPAATAVRQALAELHGVECWRILPAASASEFIQRITAVTGRWWPGAVQVPQHAYGDYAAAALAWQRSVQAEGLGEGQGQGQDEGQGVSLRWFAEPSSPRGEDAAPPVDGGALPTVLDAVYAPLRLHGGSAWDATARDAVFVLHSPNKALGLTGIRGAYAVAPRAAAYDVAALCQALEAAAPSWPLGAHGDAMLQSWATPQVQAWVASSRAVLAPWKAALQQGLQLRGFSVHASVAPHFVVQPPRTFPPEALAILRQHGVAVRDTASFGLPGGWRVSAQAANAQAALLQACDAMPLAHP